MRMNLKRLMVFMLLIGSCVGFDRAAKVVAKDHLALSRPILYLNDFFRLQYIENSGAFLGFGWAWPTALRFWLLTVLVGIFLCGLIIYIFISRRNTLPDLIGFSLIIGGGVGNLIDRVYNNGKVIDFMNVGIGNIRTGIFNFADVVIMLGIAFLLFGHLSRKKSKCEPAQKPT
jgi:signal peptidase II